ncbi:MAG: site-2 protease family protein [Ruminococcaceae bacterium]|nr:site-2 protease family protein [Oscillospiraceae bacterium]
MFNEAYLIAKLLTIPGIIFAFSLRGYAQALVAKKLGDDTPEKNGQLTMNPIAHIDIIGFLCILILGIGWGKPVQTNSRNYKHIRRDMTIQILSGPAGLVFGGVALSFFYALVWYLNIYVFDIEALEYLATILLYGSGVCITLANFYLIPLPGLDGYNLIVNYLPYKVYRKLYTIEKYSMFIFLGFILLIDYTSLRSILFAPADITIGLLDTLWNTLFGLIFVT